MMAVLDCGPVYGCTDVNALNYNEEATLNGQDDGSCQYPSGCQVVVQILGLRLQH